jgi:hypothetical protein
MATGRIPTTANSPLTVKGDLFGYSTTQARVPVGNDGETLVADSSTSTGLSYQANFAAGKNKIINGDFGIWQRGTSFTNPTVNQYLADRWFFGGGSNFTGTISAQTFTPGTAPVAGYEGTYFWRFNGSATTPSLLTRLEDVRTFAGQTVTFSFWAKANTSFATGVMNMYQYFGSGGSTGVDNTVSGVTLTTSWTRYSFTISIPSIAGKTIGTGSYLQPLINFSTMSSNTVDIWGVQVEAGSTATAFQTATGTIQGELAACQRYYQTASKNYVAWAESTTIASGSVLLPVVMRTAPTIAIVSGTSGLVQPGVGNFNASSINSQSSTTSAGFVTFNSSGLTALRSVFGYNDPLMSLSSEL